MFTDAVTGDGSAPHHELCFLEPIVANSIPIPAINQAMHPSKRIRQTNGASGV